ncbi:putative lipoprotein [Ralstonia insidiosa]|nr:putative lipoprotein [Ralstonia insidiosa]
MIGAACAVLFLFGCGGGSEVATTTATQSVPAAATPATTVSKVVLGYVLNTTASLTSAMSATTP